MVIIRKSDVGRATDDDDPDDDDPDDDADPTTTTLTMTAAIRPLSYLESVVDFQWGGAGQDELE